MGERKPSAKEIISRTSAAIKLFALMGSLGILFFACATQPSPMPADTASSLYSDSPIYTNMDHNNAVESQFKNRFAAVVNDELALGTVGLLRIGAEGKPANLTLPVSMSCASFLVTGKIEQDGFGMYSYILFSRRPTTEAQHRRYKNLFSAFSCALVPFKEKYEVQTPLGISFNAMPDKKSINLTYWPLNVRPPEINQTKTEEYEAFFVENYDYVRSRIILSRFKELNSPGPFIISCHRPVGTPQHSVLTDEFLVIDLTRIDEDLFQDVFIGFRNMVKDSQSWNDMFSFDLIRIHVISALKIHGKPAIDAAQWLLDFINVKEAHAKE